MQLVVALALGLVLVASGLYLWRRPRVSEADVATAETGPQGAAPEDAGAAPPAVDAASLSVTLADPRVIGCHDRGPKVTLAGDCDHLPAVEQALLRAIQQAAGCFPSTADGATIEYVADVSFSRRRIRVTTPRAGRSEQDKKIVAGCGVAVREAMHTLELDGLDHRHARYEIAVTASYRGRP